MKKITYEEIKSFNPCYDPVKYIKKDFNGTLASILKMKKVPAKDRLWVVVRHQLMTDKQLHLYGLACARMSEKYTTDKRVKECNDVVERYINGKATIEELNTAESAAVSAAVSALSAESAAAAWSAAESAAESAESARSARSAAWSAARSAAWSAARSALSAAWSAAAESAAEEEQCMVLIKILKETK